MNILIITDYYPPGRIGGVGEVASSLCQSYRNLGHSVYVLTTGEFDPVEREQGIWRSNQSLIGGVLINNWWAPKLISRFKIDLVHLHQASSTLWLMGLRRPSAPVVLNTVHLTYSAESSHISPLKLSGHTFWPTWHEYLERFLFIPVHRVLERAGLLRADFITVLNSEAPMSVDNGEVPITVIPNGIQLPTATPDTIQDAELLEFIGNRKVIMFVGVFRMRKRLQVLLLAMQKLVERHPDAVLLVLGGGRGHEKRAIRLVEQLDIEHYVRFLGTVSPSQVHSYLKLSDAFCIVSSLEGMPMALLEAMMHGVAVVATRFPGILDLVEDGKTALLVNVDDVEGLASALQRLLTDDRLRTRLGEAAAARVQVDSNWDRIARRYIDFSIGSVKPAP